MVGGARLYASATILSMETRLGILPWDRATDRHSHHGAARRLVEPDYDQLRLRAMVATRARLGVLVGANPFVTSPPGWAESVPGPADGSGTDAAAAADPGRRASS